MILRKYQQEAIDKLFEYWAYIGKRPIIVAPTGAGKSAIIAGFCQQTLQKWPDVRILIVTDSKEIISQNEQELKRYWPEASTGIYSAGLNRRDTTGQIIFAGVQSIYNKMYDFCPAFSIICVDEAHSVSKESDTMYGEMIRTAMIANPGCGVWGATGTPYRLDSGLLHQGDGALFDGIAYDIDIVDLIDAGYLCPVVSKSAGMHIDLDNVRTTAGEFNAADLEDAAIYIVKSAVKEIVTRGQDRRSWLVFAAGVDHARMIKNEFQTHGVAAEVVTGATPQQERESTVARFKSGNLKCLINVAVFTKGFNHPALDLIALMTATKSTAKYVQAVGRGMRTADGKADCLLLDFGENVVRHGPINLVRPKQKSGTGDGAPPTKTCPGCSSILAAAATLCPECEHEFPREIHHETTAYEGTVIARNDPFWVPVRSVEYSRHTKPGKPDSVKVSYLTTGGERYNMWLAIEHGGFASEQAFRWLSKIGSMATTVSEALCEALSGDWPKPKRIKCKQDGKFMRVLEEDYKENQAVLV